MALKIRSGVTATKEATKTAVFEEIAVESIAQESQTGQKVVRELYDIKPTQQITDATIVSAKCGIASGKTMWEDLFASDDDITRPGSSLTKNTDLNEGKISNDEYFMLYAIQLFYKASITTNIGQVSWDLIPVNVRNGSFELEQEGRIIVPEISMEVFFTPEFTAPTGTAVSGAGMTYTLKDFGSGLFRLDEPKLLYPREKLDVTMRFGAATSANDAFKIVLHGIKNFRV